jgi:hypothetical protein
MMAEAYTLREGISMAQYLGCNNFIIQSDNVVIETMLAGGFSSTSSATIFDDCKIFSVVFRNIMFQHCYREANGVTDELARHSFINHIALVEKRHLIPVCNCH